MLQLSGDFLLIHIFSCLISLSKLFALKVSSLRAQQGATMVTVVHPMKFTLKNKCSEFQNPSFINAAYLHIETQVFDGVILFWKTKITTTVETATCGRVV